MKAVVDRIEATIAVLIGLEDESVRFEIPAPLLPPGCREGDILMIRIERDSSSTKAVKARVSGLVEKLKKRK
jgi:hypothetical protein